MICYVVLCALVPLVLLSLHTASTISVPPPTPNHSRIKQEKVPRSCIPVYLTNISQKWQNTGHSFTLWCVLWHPVQKGLSHPKGPINKKIGFFIIWLFLAITNKLRIFKPGGYAAAGQSLGSSPDSCCWWLVLVSDVSVINDNFCQNKTIKQADQKNLPGQPPPATTHHTQPRICIWTGLRRELEGRNEILWGICFSQRHRHQNRCLSGTLIGRFQFMACLKPFLNFCLFIFRPFFPDMMEKKIRFLEYYKRWTW